MDALPGNQTRSLVCDEDGLVVAETVFRCILCHEVQSSIQSAQDHYYFCHMDHEDGEELSDPSPVGDSSDPLGPGTPVSPPSYSLIDSHPNIVKALSTAFTPCAKTVAPPAAAVVQQQSSNGESGGACASRASCHTPCASDQRLRRSTDCGF